MNGRHRGKASGFCGGSCCEWVYSLNQYVRSACSVPSLIKGIRKTLVLLSLRSICTGMWTFLPSCLQISRLGGVCCKLTPPRLLHWNPRGGGPGRGWGVRSGTRGPGLLSQQLQGLSQQTLAPAGDWLLPGTGSCCLLSSQGPILCSLIPPPVWPLQAGSVPPGTIALKPAALLGHSQA